VSIGRVEVKFVLLELASWSTLRGQVYNFVLVPEKTGRLIRASLYPVFPGNRPLLYQAVGATSRDIKTSRPNSINCCFF